MPESQSAKTLEGLGLLLGMIIGAGLFVLPYSFARSGIWWGIFWFLAVFFLSWFLHYLYAGIAFITPGRHRFTGYIERYLGRGAKKFALLLNLLGFYGPMLAYGVLGGIFLKNILGLNFSLGTFLFFIAGGILFFLPLREVGKINFYLTLPLLGFIILLSFLLWPRIDFSNLASLGAGEPFLPYGVLLFALAGFTALPDVNDILGRESKTLFKKIIFWSLFISALFYLIFIFAVLGATGPKTSEDALSGLKSFAETLVTIGSLIGFLAVFTSYLAFGVDLKLLFQYDYKIPKNISWLLAALPPLGLFAAGFHNLVKILSIVGSIAFGGFAILFLLITWKEHERISDFLGFRPKGWWLLALGILIVFAALQDILNL